MVGDWTPEDWQTALVEIPEQAAETQLLVEQTDELDQLSAELQDALLDADKAADLPLDPRFADQLEGHWKATMAAWERADTWTYDQGSVLGEAADALGPKEVAVLEAAYANSETLIPDLYSRLGWVGGLYLSALDQTVDGKGAHTRISGQLLTTLSFHWEEGREVDCDVLATSLESHLVVASAPDGATLAQQVCPDHARAQAAAEAYLNGDTGDGVVVTYGDEEHVITIEEMDRQEREAEGSLFRYTGGLDFAAELKNGWYQLGPSGQVSFGTRNRLVAVYVGGHYMRGLNTGSNGYGLTGGVAMQVGEKLGVRVAPGVSWDGYGDDSASDYYLPQNLGVVLPTQVHFHVKKWSFLVHATPRWSQSPERQREGLPVSHELTVGPAIVRQLLGKSSLRVGYDTRWLPEQTLSMVVLTLGV